jgi:2-keto-3-deoxy-L-fuconate dehydrogenase
MGIIGRLAGKRALITAAGQGIGRASALRMAREGAEVIATDINPALVAELSQVQGITGHVLNVLDGAAIAALMAKIGPVDILFNCAGVVHTGDVLTATEDDWDMAFDLNVKAQFRMIRAVLPAMLAQGAGSIINMSSVVGPKRGAVNRAVYGASKAAVVGLTRAVAADYITRGIRCNAVCPGTVDSPSLQGRLHATGDYTAALAAFTARQPMGRLGHVDEIAALVCYLASDEASFTTGTEHVIDGGWTA